MDSDRAVETCGARPNQPGTDVRTFNRMKRRSMTCQDNTANIRVTGKALRKFRAGLMGWSAALTIICWTGKA